MAPRVFEDIDDLRRSVGEEVGTSDWITITQQDIDDFARVTRDEQWIHVDPGRAARSPHGSTIAHGYLVMSLMAWFSDEVYTVNGLNASLNYGSDRVRFPEPVPAGSRLRGRITLWEATERPNGTRLVTEVVVEREGSAKPACVAEIIVLMT
ncbi:MaoC family dehydratase [Amycolatopsis jejuensis]|uniref:MaoC family dehydratase n=1 Tax=Amycolatopsis jejuensis TaxID=330084 RepID=UPI000526BC8C|nr:MaoC family dehydratase [Amycolatopsis jejuensis]